MRTTSKRIERLMNAARHDKVCHASLKKAVRDGPGSIFEFLVPVKKTTRIDAIRFPVVKNGRRRIILYRE